MKWLCEQPAPGAASTAGEVVLAGSLGYDTVACPLCHLCRCWEVCHELGLVPLAEHWVVGGWCRRRLCLEHPWGSSPQGKHPGCRKNPEQGSGKKFEVGTREGPAFISPHGSNQKGTALSPHPGHGATRAQPSWFGSLHPFVPNASTPAGRARHGHSGPADNGDILGQSKAITPRAARYFGSSYAPRQMSFVCKIHLGSRVMKSCIMRRDQLT